MKKNNIYITAMAAASVIYLVCTVMLCVTVAQSAGTSGNAVMNAVSHYIAAGLFAVAELVASAACIAGKMKNERSIVYSVSRLFIIVFCYNMAGRTAVMYAALGVMAVMYFVSLMKDFRQFAARNRTDTEVKE